MTHFFILEKLNAYLKKFTEMVFITSYSWSLLLVLETTFCTRNDKHISHPLNWNRSFNCNGESITEDLKWFKLQ
jgi:hypothetical protein